MKKTTNAIQEHYMIAKAHLETLENREKEIERQFIIDNGITNSDGSVPNYTWCMEDNEAFEKANEEISEIIEKSGLWAEILAAREVLKIAEVKLIKYGLSLAPAKEREILTNACKTNYTIKQKVLDLALKLDVSTVMA